MTPTLLSRTGRLEGVLMNALLSAALLVIASALPSFNASAAPSIFARPASQLALAAVTPTTFVVPAITLAAGPHSVETAFPSGVTQVALHLDTTQHLNTGVSLQVQIFWFDGASWIILTDSTVPGGIRLGDGDVVLTSHDATAVLPHPELTGRKIRLTTNAIGGSFMSSGGSLILN